MAAPSEDTVSLRPASVEDLSKVLQIERKCYPAPCVPWTQAAFEVELSKSFSNFLVLTDDATDSILMGYIVFWLLHDECHILNVAVDPDWRGLGFGQKLVRQALNMALKNDVRRAFLEVRKNNDGAVKLYQSLGFHIDHIKPRFYENGDDAYFMVRLLDQRPEF